MSYRSVLFAFAGLLVLPMTRANGAAGPDWRGDHVAQPLLLRLEDGGPDSTYPVGIDARVEAAKG